MLHSEVKSQGKARSHSEMQNENVDLPQKSKWKRYFAPTSAKYTTQWKFVPKRLK